MRELNVILSAAVVTLAGCGGIAPTEQDTSVPELVASLAHNESLAVEPNGVVYFTEMATSTIVRFIPGEGLSNFRSNSNRAGGLAFDNEGRLVTCEVSTSSRREPRVTRTAISTGEVEILADSYNGQPFNGPNGVTVDARGRIYFTDPGDSVPASVYRIDPDGTLTQLLTVPEIEWFNGIVVSPDDRVLYVGESSSAENGNRLIRAHDLAEDGSLRNMRVFYRYSGKHHGPDGLAVDTAGNLYVAAGGNLNWWKGDRDAPPPGIHVFTPAGRLLRTHRVYEDHVTDCAFGAPDRKTLYITAGKSLLSVRSEIAGTGR